MENSFLKRTVFFAVILLLSTEFSFSQKLYFCEEYTGSKEIGVSDVFTITTHGGFFTCMLDLRGTGEKINTDKITLKIEKYNGSSLKFVADEKFDVQSGWDYIYFDKFHTFYDAGKYKVTAFKPEDKPIASGDVTIEVSSDIETTDKTIKTAGAKLYFCAKYGPDEIGVSDVFYISIMDGGTFTCMVDLRNIGSKIRTDKVTLRINKLDGKNETFVADEKFDVQAEWDYIYFSDFHNFKSAGNYRVTALKPDGTKISAGVVSIRIR